MAIPDFSRPQDLGLPQPTDNTAGQWGGYASDQGFDNIRQAQRKALLSRLASQTQAPNALPEVMNASPDPVRIGGAGFENSLDPDTDIAIRQQAMQQASRHPQKEMYAKVGGKEYYGIPSVNVNPQQAQGFVDRLAATKQAALAATQREKDQAFELKKAALPFEQQKEMARMGADLEDKRYKRDHPTAYQDAENASMVGAAETEGKVAAAKRNARGEMAPDVKQARQDAARLALTQSLSKQDTPESRAQAGALFASDPALAGDPSIKQAANTLGQTTLSNVEPALQGDLAALKSHLEQHSYRYGPSQKATTQELKDGIIYKAMHRGVTGSQLQQLQDELDNMEQQTMAKNQPYKSTAQAVAGSLTGGLLGEHY